MRPTDSISGLTFIAATLSLVVPPLQVYADAHIGHPYQLDHRFLTSSSSSSSSTQSENRGAFLPLAAIKFQEHGGGDNFQVEDTSKSDGGISEGNGNGNGNGRGWYQVALHESDEGGVDKDEWLITSIPICHVTPLQQLNLDILLTSANIPISIHLSSDSGCVSNNNNNNNDTIYLPSIVNLNVNTRYTYTMKDPSLVAPRTDPTTGLPTNTEPPPEKGFLLKYWMYILAAGLFFAIVMGPDETPAQAGTAAGAK